MHFLQPTTPILFYISLHLIPLTISRPAQLGPSSSSYTIRCYQGRENCTWIFHRVPPVDRATVGRTTTSTKRSITDNFSRTFRVAALVAAGIALGLGLLRLCLLICHRSSRLPTPRRTAVVRPQLAIIGMNYVKPDLPPTYLDTMAQDENEANKLPSYDEVRDEQMSSRV